MRGEGKGERGREGVMVGRREEDKGEREIEGVMIRRREEGKEWREGTDGGRERVSGGEWNREKWREGQREKVERRRMKKGGGGEKAKEGRGRGVGGRSDAPSTPLSPPPPSHLPPPHNLPPFLTPTSPPLSFLSCLPSYLLSSPPSPLPFLYPVAFTTLHPKL